MKSNLTTYILTAGVLVLLTGIAQAQWGPGFPLPPPRFFVASLDSKQQVPANDSTATAACRVTLGTYPGSTLIVACDYSGLSSGLTHAHVYAGSVGETGSLVADLDPPTGSLSGQFEKLAGLPIGSLSPFLHKRVYVSLHTGNYPDGEIRGQLKPINNDPDFDGDAQAEIGVFRPSDGNWHLLKSLNGEYSGLHFGVSGDAVVPADYSGDGKTDIAIFRPSSGEWYILRSDDYSYCGFQFGMNGDIPIPADYDHDWKVDPAVYRPSNNTWYMVKSGTGNVAIIQFGFPGDIPFAADFGHGWISQDGKSDLGLFRPSTGYWHIMLSNGSGGWSSLSIKFGMEGDIPVPGDWTGDGLTDLAVYRPSTGTWCVLTSLWTYSYFGFPFGLPTDTPVPADYDRDGKMDAAIYRDGTWYINGTAAGIEIRQFGAPGDVPVTSSYIR